MTTATLEATGALLEIYKRSGPVFTAGEGCRLISEDGARYLDFTAGIAVNALGYGSPVVADAIREALEAGLVHTSNLFHTRPAAELAEWLAGHSFADRVFFCNSGAEANEGAFKFARRWAGVQGGEHKTEIVSFHGSFHGRTMGALAATDRPAYQAPFRPLMPGVRFGQVGDTAGADQLIRPDRTAAVIIEPLQAEGGVLPVPPAFLKALRYLCDEAGALLIFDEVQVGLGRTGMLWAHEQAGVTPDLMTVAKPLAGGLPMGAVLMTEKVAETIQPGDHATTFGGGPLVASAALATVRTIGEPAFLAEVQRKGHLLANLLQKLVLNHPTKVTAVRGTGLIWGVEIEGSAGEVAARALDAGLLVCTAGPNVVRIVPPLVIGDAELAEGVGILDEVL
ncbi:acetylornithine/succinylornithine family transaminase [Longimicrobium sp.]|uniref:aspartate aminotransferase family protein n=1 Tax=Longimicrobium sp. TaxID=2029185 RepID=UPI002C969A09|nr:acetylornithine/succinylornithine family transaminase [Longimicrobium sp.]HSU17853.1 acetylornithine/succinylornithine family transaminase [Longimicrobium sp.]